MSITPVRQGAREHKALKRWMDQPEEVASQQLEDEDVVWWAERNMHTDTGRPIEFENHPYLEKIYSDWHPRLVFYKGAQVGMTQTIVGKILYFAEHNQVNIIYTFPTAQDVDEFSATRFTKIIEGAPRIQQKLTINNARTKALGDSKIFFRGSFNERQAISIPSDLNAHDEVDFSKDDIVDTFNERLSASDYKYRWLFSTPTIPGFGINGHWRKSDMRFWLVRCVGCNTWQRVRWDLEGVTHPNIMHTRKKGWYFGCWKCSKELDRRKGMWVAKHPNRLKVHGYHVPQTIVPTMSAETMHEKEQDYSKKGRKKQFVNFSLGEAYSIGITLITKELLRSRMRQFIDPWNTDRLYLGVDQGDVLHWTICRMVENKRVTLAFGTYESFDELDTLMANYHIYAGVIDAQPNKHSARNFRDRWSGRIWINYYRTNQPQEMKDSQDEEEIKGTKNKQHYAISVDHTESLDKTAAEWINGTAWLNSSPTLLDNVRSPESTFVEHMTNLKRDEIEDKHGNMVGRWVKVGPDHFRHADNYARLAVDIIGRGTDYEFTTGGKPMTSYNMNEPVQWDRKDNGIWVPTGGNG